MDFWKKQSCKGPDKLRWRIGTVLANSAMAFRVREHIIPSKFEKG